MSKDALPVDLVKARGKKHLSREEYATRKALEPTSPDQEIIPPTYLRRKTHRQDFKRYAGMLNRAGVWSALFADELARYISSERLFEEVTPKLARAVESGEVEKAERLQRMQDRAYRQAHASASTLGLNITSFCKLVVPKAMEEGPPDDGLDL